MQNFKHQRMVAVEGALIHMALAGGDFTAAELPSEITAGSKHIAGAATGALVSIGLLSVVGRTKSPNLNAKGRKLDLLRLAPDKRGSAVAWLRANELPAPMPGEQMAMGL